MATFDESLTALAGRQHSLVSLRQAMALGGSPKMLRARVARGRLTRVDVGVFHIAGTPLTWEARLLAAVLSAGPGAAASHRSAAVLWGLQDFRPGMPEITIPRGRRYRRPEVRCHESTDLDRCGIRTRHGIPTTDPARTLLDLARYLSDQRLHRASESARRLGLSSWSEQIATLARHARRGRPGVRRLRRVIAANAHRDEVTDSDFELLVLALLLEHGLPEPVVHYQLRDQDARLLAEIDLAYPDLGIAIELDGGVHRAKDVFERDRPRQNGIVLNGWMILRFTWSTLTERPETIVEEVRAAIRLAQARS